MPAGRRVVLLSVGDELLSGDLQDGNAPWLARACAERGHRVVATATAGDQVPAIERAVRRAREDGDLVLVTGGLGPTADDLTRDGVAAAFGLALAERPELIAQLEARRLRVTAGSRRQAEMPAGATVLANPRGTAPGFLVEADGVTLAAFPGVPSEMRPMVAALLDGVIGRGPLQASRILKCAGLPESLAGEALGELMDPEAAGCRVGVTASRAVLTITVRGEDGPTLDAVADEASRRLGEHVFSRRDESLAAWCVRTLTQRGQTVSAAESCTGGLLAGALTAVPGSSAVLERSVVTYANSAKQDLLGVSAALLEEHGAVSEACARAMAEGQRAASGADHALALTGIAGPDGGTPDKPVGTVHYALASAEGTVARAVAWPGGREAIRQRSVNLALDLLRRRLQGLV